MAAKPKLTQVQWVHARRLWESDTRTGYAWLIDKLPVPVSGAAVRKKALHEGWNKLAGIKAKVFGRSAKNLADLPSDSCKRRAGQPSAYCADYANQAYRICLTFAAIDEDLAKYFGVNVCTIHRWKRAHPEFCNALTRAKTEVDARVAISLYQSAIGYSHPDVHVSNCNGVITLTPITKHYPPSVLAQIFWLKNRQPKHWRDKVEIKADVSVNPFPPKKVLDELFEASLRRSTEKAAMLTNRRDRLGVGAGEPDS